MTPAAPLEKAVHEATVTLACDYSPAPRRQAPELRRALENLLAALDADPWWSVWQKTHERQRKAEDALEEIRDSPTAVGKDIARRYFARREEKKERDAHIDEISTREVFRG